MKLGVLVSGGLGFDTLQKIAAENPIEFVFTDKGSNAIIDWCIANNTDHFVGNPRDGRGLKASENHHFDVLVSVNYLFLIEEDLIKKASVCAFNLHGSLLPKYRGRTPHVWAIINDESITGVTAHEIAKGCDTGRIIKQIEVPIGPNDTGGTILSKFTKLYYPLVSEVLKSIQDKSVQFTDQDESISSFYGKRTPEDGQIDWRWNSIQIRNWVRAQSDPYPGAFSFVNENKVIIDWVEPVQSESNDLPGKIVSLDPLLVKTEDGVVEITKLRGSYHFDLQENFRNE